MRIVRTLQRTVPLAIGGALAVALATTPASASSGWVTSNGGGAEGIYNSYNGRVYSCDIKTDGYKAVTQVFGFGDRLLVSVQDTLNNGRCSWKTPTLFEGTHKIRACVMKTGKAPTKCGPKREFYVGT